MIRWFLTRWIDKFERRWRYDASYLRDLLDADPRALMAFSKVTGIGGYRKDVPLAAYSAAGIVAVMSEDCGPCTQLAIDMAQRAGVDPDILRAVTARDFAGMPDDVVLAVRFVEASLGHAPEADDLRAEVLRRFGKRDLVSLAFAMTAARLYPTLKYAMGHGQACMPVTIGGESRPVRRELVRAA
jgi:alkylhydroperoxidase family enzyme